MRHIDRAIALLGADIAHRYMRARLSADRLVALSRDVERLGLPQRRVDGMRELSLAVEAGELEVRSAAA